MDNNNRFFIDKPLAGEPTWMFAVLRAEEGGFYTIYCHNEGHSSAHIDYINECTPATNEQAAPLKAELESIGYTF